MVGAKIPFLKKNGGISKGMLSLGETECPLTKELSSYNKSREVESYLQWALKSSWIFIAVS